MLGRHHQNRHSSLKAEIPTLLYVVFSNRPVPEISRNENLPASLRKGVHAVRMRQIMEPMKRVGQ